jgi:hypothetical protein
VSSTLLVIALVASFVNIFGPGTLAAWGLGGGDVEARNRRRSRRARDSRRRDRDRCFSQP